VTPEMAQPEGQGSSTLPGNQFHNSRSVENGESEPVNQPGGGITEGNLPRRGDSLGELQTEEAAEPQPVVQRSADRSDRDNGRHGKVKNEAEEMDIDRSDSAGGGDHRPGQPGKSGDDKRLAESVVGAEVSDENSTGENSIISTGEKSSDSQNQQLTTAGKSTGEKKQGRGRPKKQNSEKPFSPQYYEWRGDSGGWKLIYRPPLKNGKLGYEYVGFLNPQRWAFFRRFDDEQFIKAVTRLFEKRKQSRSVRGGGLRLVG